MTLTLIIFGIFWASFDFAAVVTGAVFGALINDVVPREFLGRFYGLFRIISLFVAILFNYYLWRTLEPLGRLLERREQRILEAVTQEVE